MRCSMIVLGLLVCGCQTGIYLTDDEGGPASAGHFFDYHADDVSLPYALGTRSGSRRTRHRATSRAGASSATRPTSSPSTR